MLEKAVYVNRDMGAAAIEVLPDAPGRYYALFANPSDTRCWLALGVVAVVDQCIPLNANGGSYEINLTNPFHGPCSIISDGVAKRATVMELSYAT